jgi:hypothetical protein
MWRCFNDSVGVLVISALVFTVFLLGVPCFCIVSFMYIYSYLFCLYQYKDYCHREKTQLHSQISTLSTEILALGSIRSRREPNLGCRGADRPGRRSVLLKKKRARNSIKWTGALMNFRGSVSSVILKMTVTHYTNAVNGVSLPTH